VDTQTVDQRFGELQQQGDQTAALIKALATKLSAAADDVRTREWALDLREIALAVRDEQNTTTELLQAIHALVDGHVQQEAAPLAVQSAPPVTYVQPTQYQPVPQYQPEPQYQGGYQPQYQQAQSGGTLQRFLGGRFGQAIVSGAGFGIGDDLVNNLFDRL
jgi:hypothetical protein